MIFKLLLLLEREFILFIVVNLLVLTLLALVTEFIIFKMLLLMLKLLDSLYYLNSFSKFCTIFLPLKSSLHSI